MKHRTQLALAGVAAFMAHAPANAAFVGLAVTLETPASPCGIAGCPPLWHVYAEFTAPHDRVNAWGGGATLGQSWIFNITAWGAPGSGFLNIGGPAGQTAPYSPGTTRDRDTYMTIGVRYGMEAPGGADQTTPFPGTPEFISGNQWVAPSPGGGVQISPNDPQGRADYRVVGTDTNLRVLLMQLAVPIGEHVQGVIGVSWSTDGVPGSGGTLTGVAFTSIPAPAALPVFAGLLRSSRRRR